MRVYRHVCAFVIYIYNWQSWAVSPIQYLLRKKIGIVDTFIFVFIIKIIKVFVIVSISHNSIYDTYLLRKLCKQIHFIK